MSQKNENSSNLIVTISGPSGVGKGTIVKQLLLSDEMNFQLNVSATTRHRRENEVDGKEYFFLSKEDFLKKVKNNEFVEWVEYDNFYYGTLKKTVQELLNLQKNVLFEIDYRGVKSLKNVFGLKNVFSIFILPPSLEKLRERLIDRKSENIESINKRMGIAIKEIDDTEIYDLLVINNDLKRCYNEILDALLRHAKTIKKIRKEG